MLQLDCFTCGERGAWPPEHLEGLPLGGEPGFLLVSPGMVVCALDLPLMGLPLHWVRVSLVLAPKALILWTEGQEIPNTLIPYQH